MSKGVDEYNHNKLNGGISRHAKYPTIYSGPNCISLNLGADLREMLPPFAPLYRSQDAIFGYLLHYCFDDYFSSFLPPMIEHRRNENRKPKTDPIYNFTTIGKVVITVISFLNDSSSEFADNSISSIGHRLVNFSKIKTPDAKEIILNETAIRLKGFITYAENLLKETKNAPEYWKVEMLQMIDNTTEISKNTSIAPFFWDVTDWQGQEESSWIKFMSWLEKLGILLINWPAVFEEALRLNKTKTNFQK